MKHSKYELIVDISLNSPKSYCPAIINFRLLSQWDVLANKGFLIQGQRVLLIMLNIGRFSNLKLFQDMETTTKLGEQVCEWFL